MWIDQFYSLDVIGTHVHTSVDWITDVLILALCVTKL